MHDLLVDTLPTVWHGRRIDPDFRHMVRLSNASRHGELYEGKLDTVREMLATFYRDPVCIDQSAEAFQEMLEFFLSGEQAAAPTGHTEDNQGNGPVFDYRCDAPYIVAAFQQAYGIDLTTVPLHWFRFRALFAALPEDTLMAKIMSWRSADLNDYEGKMREHYAALQERFALPADLRGGAAVVQTVAAHDAAFLARFRR